MAFYVKEEKNEKENKAVKEFTDRVEPRNVFWEKYNLIKNSIREEEKIPIQIITFYGIGGAGKSTLLERIRYELKRDEKDAKYCYIDFEKLKFLGQNSLSILNAIKTELNRKYNFEFPLFDLASYKYKTKLGIEASKPELKNIFIKNKELNFLVNFMEEIPLVGTFAKVVSLIDEGSSILRSRLKDSKLKERIKNLDNMKPDKLMKLLPYYFSVDLRNNLSKETLPFVIQLDTYERLVNELNQIGSVSTIDDWLKGSEGLIRNVDNVLWVIAGREKLKWVEEDENWRDNLDQHLLGDLSEADSRFFLKSAGVDEELMAQIYKLTKGTPVFLDMCVDTYYKCIEEGHTPTINDFSGDRIKLIERFFTYMNDNEKDFVTILAFIKNWTDENIEEQVRNVIGNFSFSLYEKIKNFSFVIKEGENYKIHETIRDVISEEASPIIKNKFNKVKKEKQEEKFKKIEEITTVEELLDEEEEKQDKEQPTEEKSSEEQKENKKGVMYLQAIKKVKYEQVIDEMVANILEFLYTKPPFKKHTKKEYCDMVKDLLEKIEEYLEVYDGRYDHEKIKQILNYKIFKNTYEYKRLEGLYLCLFRYASFLGEIDLYIYEEEVKQAKIKGNIRIYKKTRNIYKDNKEKVKQIVYSIKTLADGYNDILIKKPKYRRTNNFFFARELDIYKEILIEHGYKSSDIEMILLEYTRSSRYKEFKQGFDKFYEENASTDNVYYKRMMLRLALEIIYKEFKGKPGTGYLMRDYTLRKHAERKFESYSRNNKLNLIDKDKIEKIKTEIMVKEKNDFINKYINIAMNIIKENPNLIDSIAIKLFTKVAEALYDEPVSDEAKFKIYEFFRDIEQEILETNNPEMIEEYSNLIYRFAMFDLVFTKEYLSKNVKVFIKLEDENIRILDDIMAKMKEIYGTTNSYDDREKLLAIGDHKMKLLINKYGRVEDAVDIYIKNKDKESKYRNEKIYGFMDNLLIYFEKLRPYGKFEVENSLLIEIFDLLFEDYERKMSEYFEKYDQIYFKEKYDVYWKKFFILPMAIYERTGKLEYYKKVVDMFYEKVKNIKVVPIVNMLENFSYLQDLVHEYSLDEKHQELAWYSLKLFSKVFNNENVSEFPDTKTYTVVDFRYDLGVYTSLLLSKIGYDKYLTEKEKQIYNSYRYERNSNGEVNVINNANKNNLLEVQLYRFVNYNKRFVMSVINNIYYRKLGRENVYYSAKNAKTVSEILKCTEMMERKKVSKNAKELAIMYSYLCNTLLGNNTIILENKYRRIFEKHTQGIFKDKDGGEDYIEFKKVINTIKTYTKA